jgi:hypothetical protein
VIWNSKWFATMNCTPLHYCVMAGGDQQAGRLESALTVPSLVDEGVAYSS